MGFAFTRPLCFTELLWSRCQTLRCRAVVELEGPQVGLSSPCVSWEGARLCPQPFLLQLPLAPVSGVPTSHPSSAQSARGSSQPQESPEAIGRVWGWEARGHQANLGPGQCRPASAFFGLGLKADPRLRGLGWPGVVWDGLGCSVEV